MSVASYRYYKPPPEDVNIGARRSEIEAMKNWVNMRQQSQQRYGQLSRTKALANKRNDRTTDFKERVAMGAIHSGREISSIEEEFISQYKEKRAPKALSMWKTTRCRDDKLTESAIRSKYVNNRVPGCVSPLDKYWVTTRSTPSRRSLASEGSDFPDLYHFPEQSVASSGSGHPVPPPSTAEASPTPSSRGSSCQPIQKRVSISVPSTKKESNSEPTYLPQPGVGVLKSSNRRYAAAAMMDHSSISPDASGYQVLSRPFATLYTGRVMPLGGVVPKPMCNIDAANVSKYTSPRHVQTKQRAVHIMQEAKTKGGAHAEGVDGAAGNFGYGAHMVTDLGGINRQFFRKKLNPIFDSSDIPNPVRIRFD